MFFFILNDNHGNLNSIAAVNGVNHAKIHSIDPVIHSIGRVIDSIAVIIDSIAVIIDSIGRVNGINDATIDGNDTTNGVFFSMNDDNLADTGMNVGNNGMIFLELVK